MQASCYSIFSICCFYKWSSTFTTFQATNWMKYLSPNIRLSRVTHYSLFQNYVNGSQFKSWSYISLNTTVKELLRIYGFLLNFPFQHPRIIKWTFVILNWNLYPHLSQSSTSLIFVYSIISEPLLNITQNPIKHTETCPKPSMFIQSL